MAIEIVDIGVSADDGFWDAYAAQSAPSAFFSIAWRDVLAESFGHIPRYLMARSAGAVVGILPLFEMRHRLFGRRLVSLPFVDGGGVVADDASAEEALVLAAVDTAQQRGAQCLEIRHPCALRAEIGASWRLSRHKVRLAIGIGRDPGTHWGALSSRLRGKIRKAEKAGAVFSRGGVELKDEFYRVFCKNMRDLGTPVHAASFFENVLRRCEGCEIMLVRQADRPVAAALAVRRGATIELPWICSDYTYGGSYVNEFLYWKTIEAACSDGCSRLDLGRSSAGAGTHKFKAQWNPQEHPLFWYTWSTAQARATDLSSGNPAFALAIACWKHLPIAVANRVGPHLVRHLP